MRGALQWWRKEDKIVPGLILPQTEASGHPQSSVGGQGLLTRVICKWCNRVLHSKRKKKLRCLPACRQDFGGSHQGCGLRLPGVALATVEGTAV